MLGLLLVLLVAGCTSTSTVTGVGVHTVVTFGDSVPAGTACGCEPFPVLYARAQHAVSDNLAVAGSTSADLLEQVPYARSDIASATEVVLMIGANDLAEAFDEQSSYPDAAGALRANVVAAITEIERIRRLPVVVLGYWSVVPDGRVGRQRYGTDGMSDAASATEAANNALREASRRTGATYLPTIAAFHGDRGDQDPTALLAADGDHPDARGHAAIAGLLPPL
jgi:acyl-CoA thioesterase-1